MNLAFTTARLDINDWHQRASQVGDVFYSELLALLTPKVTQALPDNWQGLTADSIKLWFADRTAEGEILTLVLSDTDALAGLLLLYPHSQQPEGYVEQKSTHADITLHIGYLLAERFQGKGLAKELLQGLISQCRMRADICQLVGGVEASNQASIHLLEACGFSVQSRTEGHLFYQLAIRR